MYPPNPPTTPPMIPPAAVPAGPKKVPIPAPILAPAAAAPNFATSEPTPHAIPATARLPWTLNCSWAYRSKSYRATPCGTFRPLDPHTDVAAVARLMFGIDERLAGVWVRIVPSGAWNRWTNWPAEKLRSPNACSVFETIPPPP